MKLVIVIAAAYILFEITAAGIVSHITTDITGGYWNQIATALSR